jgi:NAD(P)H-nitrite reductase large subunit
MISAAVVIMLFGRRAMNLDDKVCYCFHITRRKLVNWVRLNEPRVPSQLSECGGAGTGCGWCIPFLKQIFRQGSEASVSSESLDTLTAAEYATLRAEYVRAGKGTPAPGAEPLPPEDSSLL